jgi:hypothetical protein
MVNFFKDPFIISLHVSVGHALDLSITSVESNLICLKLNAGTSGIKFTAQEDGTDRQFKVKVDECDFVTCSD